jgi:molybdopterin converting factor small subunit
MQITVKLFASFRTGRFITASREIVAGSVIADVINELVIPAGEIGTIMLNNRHADPGQRLQEGDRLALFPLVGGG